MRTRAYLDIMGGTFAELPETENEVREIKRILKADTGNFICLTFKFIAI